MSQPPFTAGTAPFDFISEGPMGPEDFGGSDEGSHYMSFRPAFSGTCETTSAEEGSPKIKAGITFEEALALRNKIFELYPHLMPQTSPRYHNLKTWCKFFEDIVSGIKRFEIRENDRDFQVGDLLILKEWDPSTSQYTGRYTEVEITYLTGAESLNLLQPNVVVMGIGKSKNIRKSS